MKIRSVGRDQFWSAGRKWTKDGAVVTIVEDDPTPRDFKRAVVDRFGCYVLPEAQFKAGDPIPMIQVRATRPFWRDDRLVVMHEGKEYECALELDFPVKDAEYQARVVDLRRKHDERGEITESDYAQIRADARFLAIEFPQPPALERKPAPAPQQAQNGKR